MASVRCQITRWVDDEPFPGLVEAELVDADRRTWTFIDKAPIFAPAPMTASDLPDEGVIRCTVLDGDAGVVTIDTSHPDGVSAGAFDEEGQTIFRVAADSVES